MVGLRDKLDVWQKDLIDVSKRNNLLYYRLQGRTAGIQIVGADLPMLFATLSAGRQFPLQPGTTSLDPNENDARLRQLQRRVREDVENRGMNTLYAAFGLLEWYEKETSAEAFYSPIVLVPVQLVGVGMLQPLNLKRLGEEEIEINPTLREKLAHDYGLALPSHAEVVEQLAANTLTDTDGTEATRARRATLPSISETLQHIGTFLPPVMRAQIHEEAHLGRFSFQKLALYQDLRKNQATLLAHPLLRAMAGERGALPRVQGLKRGRELDTIPPDHVLEVVDADSSQQEAIVAAKAGASFVLQGPPGTGKSQTITNMIAECIGDGKRVLFVSEKMAALNVVFDRLQKVGLGEFCLNLHDTHADTKTKKTFLADIEKSLQQARGTRPIPPSTWQTESAKLTEARDQLNAYERELHVPRTGLGWSAYEAMGYLAALDGVPDVEFIFAHPEQVTPRSYEHIRQAVRDLMAYRDVAETLDTHPWRELRVTSHSLALESDIRAHFIRLSAALKRQEAALREIRAGLGEDDAPLTVAWAAFAQTRMRLILDGPRPPRHWLQPEAPQSLQPLIADAEAHCATYITATARLDPRYARTLLSEDTERLDAALTSECADGVALLRPSNPHDYLLDHRDEVPRTLHAAITALRALPGAAAEVARDCGQSPPETLDGIDALLRLALCLQRTPAPPSGWLEPTGLAEARASTLDAEERYRASREARADLATRYEDGFFAFPAVDYLTRYKGYQSPLRLLKMQWYQDSRALRAVTRPEITRTPQQTAADLAMAAKYATDIAWVKDHRAEHARTLGVFFEGEQTDWERVRAALAWAAEYQACIKNAVDTPQVLQLAGGATKGIAAIRRHFDRLSGSWESWQAALDDLTDLLDLEQVAHGLVEEADPQILATALEELLASYERIWWAANVLARHERLEREAHGGVTWAALCEDVQQMRQSRDADAWLAEHQPTLATQLGPDYTGIRTDWHTMRSVLQWATELLALYPSQQVPEAVLGLVSRESGGEERHRMSEALTTATAQGETRDNELAYVKTVLPLAALLPTGTTLEKTLLSSLRARVDELLAQLPLLSRWVGFQEQVAHCRSLGLDSLLDIALHQPSPLTDLDRCFERRFAILWLDTVRAESAGLRQFDGRTHEGVISRFRDLDAQHATLARKEVIARVAGRRALAFDHTQDAAQQRAMTELIREVGKKRHPAIRAIVRRTAPAILAIKPCWLMSPLSISQYIEEAAPIFDVVIFDEASQVCPEDAICAIARGKQLIVVGDNKQLPPTRFFTKTFADDMSEEEEEEESAESMRTESILDECHGANFPEYALKWHYRSQDESLIAFSNRHFYNDALVTFPNPTAQPDCGVRWEYVAGAAYNGKSKRPNPKETERVVDLVFEYARQGHDLAELGVVALSQAHQNAIIDAIDDRLKQHPELQAWEQDLHGSGFFVKNLESVQGDEREVVILSVCYGPDSSTGRVYRRFGPVGLQGGERRLNVAITRARRQLIVVSSVHAHDLDQGGELTSVGSRVLRDFLEYAEYGSDVLATQNTAATDEVGARFDSPFEQAVYEALTARGLTLKTQVGCSGYRIDLAVCDLGRPNAYLLGIECDGATYHSSYTARDRDRLRQRQLEHMGWTIHRIWSSDWWRNPQGEVLRVLDKLAEHRIRTGGAPKREPAPVAATPPSTQVERASASHAPQLEAAGAGELASAPRRPLQVVPQSSASATTADGNGDRKIIPIGPIDRICERCQYLQQITLTATRFRCGLDQTMKLRSPSGATRGCDAWKAKRIGQTS